MSVLFPLDVSDDVDESNACDESDVITEGVDFDVSDDVDQSDDCDESDFIDDSVDGVVALLG